MYQYYPIPSCRMGALWTLSDIDHACILEFGPAGTTHFSLEGMSNLNGNPKSHAFSTHISERDLTFGDTKRLEQAILEIDATKKPRFIFVMASTLTAIIGVDIESTCDMLQDQVNAKLIPIKSDGFKGDYTYGVRDVLSTLATHVIGSCSEKLHLSYAIIGSTMDGYSSRSDVKAIERLMYDFFGATCHTVLTSGSSMTSLESAGDVSLNIALRQEGLDACQILRSRFGTPFVSTLPYGLDGIEAFLSAVEAQTGWKRKQEVYKRFVWNAQGTLRHIKSLAEHHKPRVMLSGNYDDVEGVMAFLTACGILSVFGIITHKASKDAIENLPYPAIESASEADKRKALTGFEPDIILGDGVLIELAKGLCPKARCVQTAHPNLNRIVLHHEIPHMGVDGFMYLSELVLNSIG